MASASAHPVHHPLRALVLRLLGMLMLALSFCCVKWLSEHGVHIVESLFYRQLILVPMVVLSMMAGAGLSEMRTARLGAHISRTAMGLAGMAFNFGAVILLPLAEATTIGFSVPIFATIMSVIFLGERPGIHRWIAVITGFLGVLVIVGSPGHFDFPMDGFLVAVGAALLTSCVTLQLRQMGRTEPTTTTVFYFSTLSLLPLGLLMIWFARPHEPLVWGVLLCLGLCGGMAQLLVTAALRWGSVSLVLPMDYSTLLWSTLLGWLLWRDWPGPGTWAGALIIAASSLYIAWRERVRHRETINRAVPLD